MHLDGWILSKVKVVENTNYYEDVEPEIIETEPKIQKQTNVFDEILSSYNEESQKQKALNSL
jgi:hypothetical protein